MKAILISIKPKWVADILNGKKTIEIRKTMPKCDLPIDVYIYCSKSIKKNWHLQERYDHSTDDILGYSTPYYTYVRVYKYMTPALDGKVVAKFTLNKVEEIRFDDKEVQKKSCLTEDELFDYLFVNEPYHEDMKTGYAWHISNLVIFDKPKELSEFYKYTDEKIEWYTGMPKVRVMVSLTKAPQSFMFIEIGESIMYQTIKPYGFVKEHDRDYLIFKGNRYYINTYYAGLVEITKETFEKLEKQGMETR